MGVFSGMSNKVDDKLAQCERAIRALESLRERQDKSEFEYHFCAYIGFADAINNYVPRLLKEQLRSPTLAKTWLDRLKADVDLATVIGLRNSDVHSDALRVSRQNINVTLPGYQVQTQAGVLGVQVTDAKTSEVQHLQRPRSHSFICSIRLCCRLTLWLNAVSIYP
jgi:hypothetical protein